MGVETSMRQTDVDAMRAAGLDEATIAKALALSPIKTRSPKVRLGECPACGQKSLRGDFVCGTCSELKAGSNRRFWQLVDDRERGLVGRAIYEKPGPQQLPAQTPKPIVHKIVAVREIVERVKLRREYLVTVGMVGRVVVAPDAARAAAIAHAINNDEPTVGHQIRPMGLTIAAETEIPAKVGKMGLPTAERRFRVSGPGHEVEMTTLAVTSAPR